MLTSTLISFFSSSILPHSPLREPGTQYQLHSSLTYIDFSIGFGDRSRFESTFTIHELCEPGFYPCLSESNKLEVEGVECEEAQNGKNRKTLLLPKIYDSEP